MNKSKLEGGNYSNYVKHGGVQRNILIRIE